MIGRKEILLILNFTLFGLRESCECAQIVIKPITGPVRHAEGPHWSEREQALYYVDVFKPAVLRWDFKSKLLTSCDIEGDSIGLIVPIKNRNCTYLVCADRNIYLFSWDGKRNNSGSLQNLASIEENKPHNQFNDGKADVSGNLWAGTLTRKKDLSVKNYGGSLYRIEGNNLNYPIPMLAPLSISNGVAWNKNNTKFFYIDSETRKVISYAYDVVKGTIEFPQLLFDLDEYPQFPGIPDGMTIDSEDNLWVAVFGGKAIVHVDSITGKLLDVITMPVTYVSSIAFGGPDLKVLYATTSRLKLTPEQVAKEPLAGSVFSIHNLKAQGVPANEFVLSK